MKAAPPREIELKLILDQADARAVRRLLEREVGAPDQIETLSSVYYDTPDRDLATAGVSLRVRQGGQGFVQTVKQAREHTSGLFDRNEWEMTLVSSHPDLEAFAKTPAGQAFVDKAGGLAPVFETNVRRIVWHASHAKSMIEIALDEGHVAAGRKRERLVELEFELKTGAPHDLFRFLDQLEAVESLRPGVMAKSERGYRLADGAHKRASKAGPILLNKDMTAADVFRTIAHGCLQHFGCNVPLVVERRKPEALHQSRVALRRLRSAMSLFKPLIADRSFEPLRKALQALSHSLGDARNLDVYLADHARPELTSSTAGPDAKAFLQTVTHRRDAAYDEVVARLKAPDTHKLLLRLLEWIEAGPWLTDDDPMRTAERDRPARTVAAEILDKRFKRVKRRGRHLAALDPEARHRVRIEVKKLRYASEFFTSLVTKQKAVARHAEFADALEQLQEHLGALNDIQTAHEFAVRFAEPDRSEASTVPTAPFSAAHVSGRLDAQVGPLLAAAESAHGRLAKTRRFWSAWRA